MEINPLPAPFLETGEEAVNVLTDSWGTGRAQTDPQRVRLSWTKPGQLTVRISLTCITAHYSANIRSPPKCPAPLRISLIVRAQCHCQSELRPPTLDNWVSPCLAHMLILDLIGIVTKNIILSLMA